MEVSTDMTDLLQPVDAPGASGLVHRISRFEWFVAAAVGVVMLVLVALEPDILGAPFENARTVVFTFGGTVSAAVALVVMLRFRVHPVVRVLVLGAPFVAVTWWLISPFFVDDVVNDEFATSISDATADQESGAPQGAAPAPETNDSGAPSTTTEATGPTLIGSGQFVGLAGHDGSGDAGFFRLADGSLVLRFENFDIDNGPDLRLYVVPGANQTDPGEGSLYLGELRGNVGDQTYDLRADFTLTPGDWTVLVWCEAFSVEFVAATVTVAA
jgi:hypothetical protein